MLGIFIDAGVTMSSHVSITVASCFSALRQLRSIQRSVSRSSTVLATTGSTVSRYVTCAVALGLRECNSCRHSQTPAGSSPVSSQCSSTPHLPSSQVRPRVSTASGTTLVVCSWMHQIQTGRTCVSLLAQLGTWVPCLRPPVGRSHRLSPAYTLVV